MATIFKGGILKWGGNGDLRESLRWGRDFRSQRRLFMKKRVVTNQVPPRGQWQSIKKSLSVLAMMISVWTDRAERGTRQQSGNWCKLRQFRWWMQNICQVVAMNGRRATREKLGEAWSENTPLYSTVFKDVRIYQCWGGFTGVEEIEDTWEREELITEQGPRETGKEAIILPISHLGLGKGAIHNRCLYEIYPALSVVSCTETSANVMKLLFTSR